MDADAWALASAALGGVTFVLTDDAGYVMGQTVVADGGINRTAGM